MLATEQLKVRVPPDVKRYLFTLAKREGRSQANMVRTLIVREYQAMKIAEKEKSIQINQPVPVA